MQDTFTENSQLQLTDFCEYHCF